MANDEWITPPWIIALARDVLGRIDLDPASSDSANASVQAKYYYTRDKPCSLPWGGRVWLNPPYSRGLIKPFVEKFCTENFDSGIMLVNADTSTEWFHRALESCNAVCLLRKRVSFIDPKTWKPTKGNTRGQAIFLRIPHVTWGDCMTIMGCDFLRVFGGHGFAIGI